MTKSLSWDTSGGSNILYKVKDSWTLDELKQKKCLTLKPTSMASLRMKNAMNRRNIPLRNPVITSALT